jgi:hypothetical protein
MEKKKRGRGPYYKWDGHKSAVIMLRVTPEEKAAWTASALRGRNGWMRGLSEWLRVAAVRYARECEEAEQQRAKVEARAKTRATKKESARGDKTPSTLRRRVKFGAPAV